MTEQLGNSGGKPDFTAWGVANGIKLLSEDPQLQRLIPPKMAKLTKWFVDEVDTGHPFQATMNAPDMTRQKAFGMYEALVCEGMHVSYGTRKEFVEKQVRKALKDGIAQVVVMGGGFDTLAMRLHKEYPQANFFEIDHPSTQNAKLKVLERHKDDPDAQIGPNMHFVSADFSNQRGMKENLVEKTDATGRPLFEQGKPTIFVAEGVMMYLTPAQVEKAFSDMQELTKGNAVSVFSTSDPAAPRTEELQKVLVEGNASEQSALSDADMQEILARQGFSRGQRHSYHELTGSRLGEFLGRPTQVVSDSKSGLTMKEILGEDYYVAGSKEHFRAVANQPREGWAFKR